MEDEETWEVVSTVSEFSYVDSIFHDDDEEAAATLSVTPPSPLVRKMVGLDPARTFKEVLLSGSGGPTSARGVALKGAPSRLGRIPRKQRVKKDKLLVRLDRRLQDDDDEDAHRIYLHDPKRRGRLKRYRPRAPLAAKKPVSCSFSEHAPEGVLSSENNPATGNDDP